MSIYFVYIYKDPINNTPFYVGYGKNKRHLDHLNEAKRQPTPKATEYKLNKIRKILSMGVAPIIEIFKENLEKHQATELEKELIKKFGTLYDGTGTLTNLTKGGDGGDTSKSPNYIKAKEEGRFGLPGEKNGMYGTEGGMKNKKHTDKAKKLQQKSISAAWANKNSKYHNRDIEGSKNGMFGQTPANARKCVINSIEYPQIAAARRDNKNMKYSDFVNQLQIVPSYT